MKITKLRIITNISFYPTVLKAEYLAWLPESLHHKVGSDWDKMISSN